MSKRQPGQVVLDTIDFRLNLYEVDDYKDAKVRQGLAELRAWKAAFKKMAGANIFNSADGEPYVAWESNAVLAKLILKAREVEARRKT